MQQSPKLCHKTIEVRLLSPMLDFEIVKRLRVRYKLHSLLYGVSSTQEGQKGFITLFLVDMTFSSGKTLTSFEE